MKQLIKTVFILLALSLTLIAKDVATVTALNGEAFIQRGNTKVTVILGIKLQEKDIIITSEKAKVQVIFSDETIITIGKNSNFSISEFLYEEDTEPVAKFSMLKGAMRTITGKIGKIAPEKFTVKAKTATIGIRGTNFTVNMTEDGTTNVYCTFGAISTTISGTQYIIEQGHFIAIAPDGTSEIKEFQADDLKEIKKQFSKSEKKDGIVSNDSSEAEQSQIDTTTEDLDNVIIQDISDSLTDSNQLSSSDTSLADLLSGYNMSNAFYSGTYTTTNTGGILVASSGTAELSVDFGMDTIDLNLLGLDAANSFDIHFNQNSSITGVNFNATQNIYSGSASGTFNGSTGNNATGNFIYKDDGGGQASGIFDVTSSQTLK